MHAAPPVRMELGPDRPWSSAVALCAGVAGANLAAWAGLHAQWALQTVAAAALAAAGIASGSALRWARRSATTGVLVWDGSQWQASNASAACASVDLQVMIDLGPWMLLRTTPTERIRPGVWWVASKRRAGAAWPHWRAALYAGRPRHDPAPSPDAK